MSRAPRDRGHVMGSRLSGSSRCRDRMFRCAAVTSVRCRRCVRSARPSMASGDVGRADAVAVGDGGQPLDVHARAAGRTPRSRPRTAAGSARRRGRPGSGAGRAARRRPRAAARRRSPRPRASGPAPGGGLARLGGRRAPGGSAPRARRPAAWAKRPTASGPAVCGQELQRLDGEVVVGGAEAGPAGVGEDEDPGRTAAAAGAVDPLLRERQQARSASAVEVPPDARRRSGRAGRPARPPSTGRARGSSGRRAAGWGRSGRSPARRRTPPGSPAPADFTMPVCSYWCAVQARRALPRRPRGGVVQQGEGGFAVGGIEASEEHRGVERGLRTPGAADAEQREAAHQRQRRPAMT